MSDVSLRQTHVAPSILSADFARLGEEVEAVLRAGARVIHVDVMDGHFVPNITIGPVVARCLHPYLREAGALMDVHLMIEHPERYVDAFAAAGADLITVHQEACRHLHRVIAQIHEAGVAAGVALNPATPLEMLDEVRKQCDLVLVMSVDPGFGGQRFIETSIAKLERARAYLPERVAIEVDGGAGRDNIAELVAAGANLIVAGSSVFGHGEAAERFRELSGAVAG